MTIRYAPRRYARSLSILLAITLTAVGCASPKPQLSPPGEAPVSPSADVAPPVTSQTAAVFFADWQFQHMIPEVRQVPQADGAELATQVVRELLVGPTDPHLERPIPADVTLLEPVTVREGTAYVNLSRQLRNVQGAASVTAALNALRLSLTEIPSIQLVEVLIEGQAGGEFGGVVLEEPMDRGLYLYPVFPNPERIRYLQERHAQGLEPWRADPLKVAQWEGRMFGFTAAELQGAKVVQQGTQASVQVARQGSVYAFTLGQNQEAQGQGIWTIQAVDRLVRHSLSGLPPQIRAWADLYAETTVGVSRQAGGRTYLMAAVEAGAIQIDSVAVADGHLVVYLVEQGTEQVALASITGADGGLPVTFRWREEPVGKVSRHTAPDLLPSVQNPHGLPEVRLTGETVVISPTPDQAVTGPISIKGYARHLYEANLVARLLDQQGNEVARGFTTAGACCYDWGSFDFELKHGAPAGAYRLELGNYSPKDGEWEPRLAIPLNVAG